MFSKNLFYYLILSLFLLFASCVKDDLESKGEDSTTPDDEQVESEITKLVIPEDFDFATQQNITVLLSDTSPYVRYDVYAYNDSSKRPRRLPIKTK